MKIIPQKTYRFGRFTISISTNETVVIYAGEKSIHVRTFRRDISPRLKTALGASAAFLVLLASLLVMLPTKDISDVDNDDRMKNDLLQSSQTEFTQPDESEKLIIRKHSVKPGETLSHIAAAYGVSIDTICGSSNLRSYDLIHVGQVLTVPNKDGILYTMNKGGNIVAIAKKYGVSLEKIISQNDVKNPDFVANGTTLFIPDAKPQNIIRGFLWPTRSRVITCGYGWRRNPFNGKYREFHSGTDIRSNYEWVRSARYGKVTYTGWLGGYGKTVVVSHPGGWKTLYAHLSHIIVRPGQYIKQGQNLGKSGNTGRSTGAHLHFEITRYGRHKNPYPYLTKGR